jgi:hypothetical protein
MILRFERMGTARHIVVREEEWASYEDCSDSGSTKSEPKAKEFSRPRRFSEAWVATGTQRKVGDP